MSKENVLKLETKTLRVELDDKHFNLRYPAWGESEELAKSEDPAKLKVFLVSVGLPEDVVNGLQLDHVLKLIEELTQSKKK
jgi:hypothetical protein